VARRAWIPIVVCAACLAIPRRALAQDPSDSPPPQDATGTTAGISQKRPYWRGSGPWRPFMAAVFDFGIFYARPRMQLGWGKPHWSWVGLEIGTGISSSGPSFHTGLRMALPMFDFRVGARYETSLDHYFLTPRESYERLDIEERNFGRARYLAAEAELSSSIPLPCDAGSIITVISGYNLLGVPEGTFVFDEQMKVVVDPPFYWRARLGYLAHIGWEGTMRLGAAAEVIHLPEREDYVVRAGPAISVSLTHHLETLATVMIVAHGPDNLGLVGADFGQLGLRYRWATGDRFPELP
jgi:hypothetical protein